MMSISNKYKQMSWLVQNSDNVFFFYTGKALVKNQKIGASEFHGDHTKVPPLSPSSSKLHWEIMRSMDPDGYRNLELEVWEETKKGMM